MEKTSGGGDHLQKCGIFESLKVRMTACLALEKPHNNNRVCLQPTMPVFSAWASLSRQTQKTASTVNGCSPADNWASHL